MTGALYLQGWPEGERPAGVPAPLPPVPALAGQSRLVFVAAADAAAREVERFGLGAFWHVDGASTVAAGLVIPDDHPAAGELAAWCARRFVETPAGRQPWRCESLSAFCNPWRGSLRRLVYGRSGWLVGADLGRSLGLIAEEWRPARGTYAGGFTLWPRGWSRWREDATGRKMLGSVSPNLPPLRVVASTATSYSVAWGRPPGGPGFGRRLPDGSHYKGLFFDVVAAAFPLDGVESADLADHAEAFGLPRRSVPAAVPVDVTGAEALAETLDVVRRLADALDVEGRQWLTSAQDRRERVGRIDLRFLTSPGTLAARIDERSRAVPMLSVPGAPDDREMGRWMGAHHGAWLSAELAGAGLFSAVDVDVHSGYPTDYRQLGCHELRVAERYEREDVTADLRALCADLAAGKVDALLDPATWERFGATVCELRPAGETWSVHSPDRDFPDGHAAMRPVTSSVPLPFTWCAVTLASLRAGREVDLRSAVRLVPRGRQRQVVSTFPLYGGRWVRNGEDPALALVRLRDEAKRRDDDRLAADLRVVVNSLYGNAARIDQYYARQGRREVLAERVSRGSFPPIAASVTDGCRLVVGLAEHLVEKAGGTVASRDTDGLLLVSSPEGGPVTLADGRVVGAISWGALDAILARFDGLAPFGPGVPFFKAPLREHGGRPLFGTVLRVKRYALGTFENGELVELVKATEHGLGGQVADPPGLPGRGPDGQHLWTRAVAAEALRRAADPSRPTIERWPWDAEGDEPYPALQRCQVGSPEAVVDLAERYGISPAPFGRYVLGLSLPPLGSAEAPPVAALDPGGDLSDWRSLSWRAVGGREVAVTTDPAKGARAHVLRSLDDKALAWLRPRPLPHTPLVIDDARMIRTVGRGGRLIAARAAGDTETPTETLRVTYRSPDLRPVVVGRVRAMGPVAFAEAFGVPLATAKRWSNGTWLPDARWTAELVPLLGGEDRRTCALDGCSRPIDGRRTYCCTGHAERGRKRHQRDARSNPTGKETR